MDLGRGFTVLPGNEVCGSQGVEWMKGGREGGMDTWIDG